MIPIIGLLIALYTSIRFIEIIADKDKHTFIQALAVVALLATIFLSLALVLGGSDTSPPAFPGY